MGFRATLVRTFARARQTPGENKSQLRGSDKITPGAQLGCAGAVVTQTRRIQRQVHVAGKIQGTAGCGDFLANQRGDPFAVGVFVRTEWGQFAAHAGNWRENQLQSLQHNQMSAARGK